MASHGNQHCASCIGTLSFLVTTTPKPEVHNVLNYRQEEDRVTATDTVCGKYDKLCTGDF